MSAGWEMLHFMRPHWLWGLLGLPLLWLLWRGRQRRDNAWRGVVDAHLLPHLLEAGGRTGRGGAWLGALGWVLAVLALAGPSWRQEEQPLWQSQAPLVIAFDLSTSIAASDLPPSRLLQARAKIATLLRERSGGQVALVAYAGDAFTVAPLTDDAANVALFLDALEPSVMPVDGQRVDKAIDGSVRLLQQAGFEKGDILVLADHAEADAGGAAVAASRQGFRVSVLGLGTTAGAPYRDGDGRIAQARLQPGSLIALAGAGGGGYRALAADDRDLRALGLLDPQQADATSQRGGKVLSWRDDGYWLLLPLMLLALLAFRRGGAFAAVLLCASLTLAMPAQAADGGWWQRADQQQHQRIERGVDAYRKGDFKGAGEAFAGIDSADALYNQGNALAKQGRYDEAIAAYDQALRRQPGMEDAIENRKVVDAARKRSNPPGQGRQDPGKGGNPGQAGSPGQDPPSKPSGKPSPGQSPPAEPASTQPHGPAPAPRPAASADRAGTPKPAQPAADPKAQQAADAAQRERMRQALAAAGKDGTRPGQAQTGTEEESAQEREKRQAVDAWLRRVPDDPGGLLKAKFRLEYERRQKEGR